MSKEADELKGLYFPCLDHGFVALIDYMGGDSAVMQAARVSYGAGTKTVNEDRGLLRYMMRPGHTSPFEMVELKFHVRLPIFVARQLIRHRTASVNEYSLRYSLPAMQFYVPAPEHMGTQSKKNKQGRAAPVADNSVDGLVKSWLKLQEDSVALYNCMIDPDVDLARELARMHLPLSIYTEWYWKIDLHNLLHFLKLRCDGHAQWEIQQVAKLKAGIAKVVAPLAFEAWIDYSFQARTFSRMEMQLLRQLIGTSIANPDTQNKATGVGVASGFWDMTNADEYGISQREWSDFMTAFDRVNTPDLYAPTDFTLDMSTAKSAEYFAE